MVKYYQTILVTLALLFVSLGLAAQFQFRISGKVVGRDSGTLVFVASLATQDYVTVPFKNGEFVFEGEQTEIQFYDIALLEDVLAGHLIFCPFILEPGNTRVQIICEAPVDSNTPLRVKFDEAGEMNQCLEPFTSFLEFHKNKSDSLKKGGYTSAESKSSQKEWSNGLNRLLNENSGNVLGLLLAYRFQGSYSTKQIQSVLSELPLSIATTKYYKIVRSKFIGSTENDVGDVVSDFWLPDRNGNPISISEVASKNDYTLLEFWGSWCGPCIEKARGIIPIYDKYKDHNFEIYGIALEVKEARWTNAIDKEGYEWINVIELQNGIKGDYCISRLLNPDGKKPFGILLDRNMKIVAIDQSPVALDKFLSKSLAKKN